MNAQQRRKARRAAAQRPSMLSYLAALATEQEAEARRMAEEDARKRREQALELKRRRLVHMRAIVTALGGDTEAITYDDETGSPQYAEGDIVLSLKDFTNVERIDSLDHRYKYPHKTTLTVSSKHLDTYYTPQMPQLKITGEDVTVLYPKPFALDVFKGIALLLHKLRTSQQQEEPTA